MFGAHSMEVHKVSRKTPADGKLEISARLAASMTDFAEGMTLVLDGRRGRGRLISMTCTCTSAEGEHVHHFLESDLLRTLTPERDVLVELLRDAATVLVSPR
jgi:hypothetical protein